MTKLKAIRALLINSAARTITEVTLTGDILRDMQRLVGGYIALAGSLTNGDDIFVDDEGLLKRPTSFFTVNAMVNGPSEPLAGCGVVVGHTRNGDATHAKSTIADLKKLVHFYGELEMSMFLMKRGGK